MVLLNAAKAARNIASLVNRPTEAGDFQAGLPKRLTSQNQNKALAYKKRNLKFWQTSQLLGRTPRSNLPVGIMGPGIKMR